MRVADLVRILHCAGVAPLLAVLAESPELAGLLQELKAKAEELREKALPVLATVRAGQLPTSTGVSFLEVKYQLLLSYINHILFYLLLKAEGKSVKDHPVMEQLHHIR
jgi:U3 small nucleolar RNA-associated protein 3